MKKTLLFVSLLVIAVVFNAKSQIDFEGMLHDYQNGATLNGGFHSNNYQFVNYYDATWGSWSGFAYSKMTDATTSGWSNQYSAVTGSGYNGSSNYLVANVSPYNAGTYIKFDTASALNGFYVTNSTYAHNSMRDGDSFAKQFGSLTDANGDIDGTNGEDWFLLTIKGYNNGVFTDSVKFYLADYRFVNSADDYIVDTWTMVDLTALNTVDSITFSLSSSDIGAYGMNTPAYFCLDFINDENDVATDFEEFQFDYYNGSDLAGGFASGEGYFYNDYNEAWGSWSGFSYSRVTDNTTSGWINQYSAITGEGYDGSETYAISYGVSSMKFDPVACPEYLYVTNSTYAHNSMRDGDAYAKQFGSIYDANGDIDGTNGEDWLLLTIRGYNDGIYVDSINFYLADYRFADDNDDYIIDEWTQVSLSELFIVDSLTFTLTSSDNGAWGMNTPAYFCIDNIMSSHVNVNNVDNNISDVTIYPNPVTDILNIRNTDDSQIIISDLSGKVLYNKQSYNNIESIDFSNFNTGIYIVTVKTNDKVTTKKVVKR